MRTINIQEQEYESLGLVNNLSYEILPYKEPTIINNFFSFFGVSNNSEKFPFSYTLSYNGKIIKDSKEYMTPEELDDWSVYQIMDEKIKAKLELI
tara:strand:+ start:1502 stop:1786 length:285 start_codon:yes stop_codon:yes gene_type:complete